MKKIILSTLLFAGIWSISAQDFTIYNAGNLKVSHDDNGTKIKHIAAAKMIVLEDGNDKDSFYFDASGKLKAVSGKGYSYEVASKKVIKKNGGTVVSEDAPTPDFLSKVKAKLEKALNLLKK